jgi:chloramphenicol-sensitive protein RarD
MLIGAVVMSANWLTFIWAVVTDRVLDISLGYFVNPLLLVALGVLVLRERLTRAQGWAIALAAAGVAYMAIRAGSLPWISLVLAGTFGIYGLLKKQAGAAPAVEAVFGETALMAIPGSVYLMVLAARSEDTFGGEPGISMLLVAAGAVTVIPLLLFGSAAQRIPLATVGILQYLAPSFQFLLGVFAYGEAVSADRLIGFVLVWIALALYTGDNLRRGRAARRAGSA